MTEEYTPLPVGKWTPSSMIKHNDLMWSRFLKKTLDNKRLSKEQKNHIIDYNLKWMKSIHDNCVEGSITWKKIVKTSLAEMK